MTSSASADNPLFAAHSREFAAYRCVYPVVSRRAGGISIGVNLNPDRFCNFHCVYCQIDRTAPAPRKGTVPFSSNENRDSPPVIESVDLNRLADELDRMVAEVVSGRIFEGPRFCNTPAALRRLNDIAFSGDGEPTACPDFDRAVDICAEVRRRHNLDQVKLVLITNATLFHRPRVRRALETLDANNGEIWAKLDAGSEEHYRLVDRSAVPWRRILDNLREAAVARPIVIQSLFLRMHGKGPAAAELEAYCERLREIVAAGGRIKLVQVHTIARPPAESWATALADAEVDAIADLVRSRTGLPVAAFYGAGERGR
jgi:wyosine [tRNA(Phe)-imidazoG37] synthetase (radical SAM superfamily)